MIDLTGRSGLPLQLDEGGRLSFGDGMVKVAPDVRTLDDARGVLWNMTATEPKDLYYMYRGVCRQEDQRLFVDAHIRYDVTVVMPGKIGGEYVKTVGHYHPEVPGTGVSYPEVYEVIHGKAHYLLQKADESGKNVSDVVIVEAGPGDTVLIPPGYGHVTINPGDEPLVMCNLIEHQFKSVYAPMASLHGAAFYEIEEDGEPVFVENEHYEQVADPRMLEPRDMPAVGGAAGPAAAGNTGDTRGSSVSAHEPLYVAFIRNPKAFDFLVRPHLSRSDIEMPH